MNILYNAKLGDGFMHMNNNNVNAKMGFMSKNLEYLLYKLKMCLESGFSCTDISMGVSGYTGSADIYRFYVRVSPAITSVYKTPVEDVLRDLSKEDLAVWFLDDGSYHRRRNTMHLYCNSLSEDQVVVLQDRIFELYGTMPNLYWDKKKDGRKYPYLYYPRELVKKAQEDVISVIRSNSLYSMNYKTGHLAFSESEKPSTTNEQIQDAG